MVAADSRTRAKQIESVAHKTLAPYAAEVDHRGDGHSEWFEPVAHPMAVRLLTQVPLDERPDRRARLTAIRMKASPANAVSIETGPQHCWWALEDLWSRVAMHCRVTAECEGDVHTLVIEGFRQPWAREEPVAALRTLLMDMSTYAWNEAGCRDDYIKLIDYRGDDLICRFASLRLIETWPDGPDLVWQVRGFLLRLHRLALPTRQRAGAVKHHERAHAETLTARSRAGFLMRRASQSSAPNAAGSAAPTFIARPS